MGKNSTAESAGADSEHQKNSHGAKDGAERDGNSKKSDKLKAAKAARREQKEREEAGDGTSNGKGAKDHTEKESGGRAAIKAGKAAAMAAATAASSKAERPDDEKVWVQCNECDKWRSLPSHVDPDLLPDIWVCSMNQYDDERNHCDAPEEHYKLPEEEKHVPLKAWCKLWTKRLKSADRAENRLSTSAVTRGNKKRRLDTEWIRCCNPSCGKWRAIARGIDSNTLLKRLYKGRHQSAQGKWYCSMNNWDDTTASCAAPQEPLWNCKWNLHNR